MTWLTPLKITYEKMVIYKQLHVPLVEKQSYRVDEVGRGNPLAWDDTIPMQIHTS